MQGGVEDAQESDREEADVQASAEDSPQTNGDRRSESVDAQEDDSVSRHSDMGEEDFDHNVASERSAHSREDDEARPIPTSSSQLTRFLHFFRVTYVGSLRNNTLNGDEHTCPMLQTMTITA